MITNAKVTIFLASNNYGKSVYDCHWQDIKQTSIHAIHLQTGVKAIIRIPTDDTIVFTSAKDIIFKGETSLTVNVSTEDKLSETIYAIMQAGGQTVMATSDKRYGSPNMHHYEVSA